MLKKPANKRRPLFGLSDLSSLSGFWLNETYQMNQIDPSRLSRAVFRILSESLRHDLLPETPHIMTA
jgi:hypothetical protein